MALLVRAYQLVLRPLLPPACRFVPSCSDYAIEALHTHGAWHGLVLASWRIVRCNPFCAAGYDPVPPCGDHARALRGAHCVGAGCDRVASARLGAAPGTPLGSGAQAGGLGDSVPQPFLSQPKHIPL